MEKESGLKPSQLSESQFVEHFGTVYEHSPWVAQRSYLNITSLHDNPTGVHKALCRAFRSATEDERLNVLRAHPDLAGKLAAARRLTKHSSEEQASAGLVALTDEEQQKFTILNQKYKEKYGFPFIIAVRNHTRQAVLEAFERRLGNDLMEEREEACKQVEAIARLRIEHIFHDDRDADLKD
ncbi:unnamed protein product [Agarophyton chilense]